MSRTPPKDYIHDNELATIMDHPTYSPVAKRLAEVLHYERGLTKDRAEKDAEALLARRGSSPGGAVISAGSRGAGPLVDELKDEAPQCHYGGTCVSRDSEEQQGLVDRANKWRERAGRAEVALADLKIEAGRLGTIASGLKDELARERETSDGRRSLIERSQARVRELTEKRDERLVRAEHKSDDAKIALDATSDSLGAIIFERDAAQRECERGKATIERMEREREAYHIDDLAKALNLVEDQRRIIRSEREQREEAEATLVEAQRVTRGEREVREAAEATLATERDMAAGVRTRVLRLEAIVAEKQREAEELSEALVTLGGKCDHDVRLTFYVDGDVRVVTPDIPVDVEVVEKPADGILLCRVDDGCMFKFIGPDARDAHEAAAHRQGWNDGLPHDTTHVNICDRCPVPNQRVNNKAHQDWHREIDAAGYGCMHGVCTRRFGSVAGREQHQRKAHGYADPA